MTVVPLRKDDQAIDETFEQPADPVETAPSGAAVGEPVKLLVFGEGKIREVVVTLKAAP